MPHGRFASGIAQGMSFDPYDQWLKIPPGAGPPSHYDLLGLTPFEADPQRIHDAGIERIGDIRRY